MAHVPWPAAAAEFVTTHWSTSSASAIAAQISEKFGFQASRNAVIGKAARLKLPTKRTGAYPSHYAARKAKTGEPKQPIEHRQHVIGRRSAEWKEQPIREHHVTVEPLRLLFAQLTEQTCKFECSGQHDAANYHFCGNQVALDCPYPYCAEHAQIVRRA
jgi:hypothetical protein